MEGIEKVITTIKGLASSEEFLKRRRMSEKALIRERKLNVTDIVYFVLSLKKATLPFELERYFSESGRAPVVPSSMSKARSKLSYTAFEEIFNVTVAELPGENQYKGYKILYISKSLLAYWKNRSARSFMLLYRQS